MTLLTAHLPFALSSPGAGSSKEHALALPPAGTHVVLSDSLNSPADFALSHFVFAAVSCKRKVVMIDFRAEGRAAWDSLARKVHISLPGPSSTSWVHIAPTSLLGAPDSKLQPPLFNLGPSLAAPYRSISSVLDEAVLAPSAEGPLVVLDGLNSLNCLGFQPAVISRFVRAVLAKCREASAILISCVHADCLDSQQTGASPQTELLRRLCRLGGGTWWRIGQLGSGRSGEVMGEISCHANFPSQNAVDFPRIPQAHPLQYRLTDGAVKVFHKGTGRGFL